MRGNGPEDARTEAGEAGAVGGADPARRAGDDLAPAARQIAHRERRHLARDERGKKAHAGLGVGLEVARRLDDRADRRDRRPKIRSIQHPRLTRGTPYARLRVSAAPPGASYGNARPRARSTPRTTSAPAAN